jgi:hypothetical protein
VLVTPLLGRSVLDAADLTAERFLRSVVLPPTVATLVLVAAVAVPVVLPLTPLPTVLLGSSAGLLAYGWSAPRFGMRPGELSELLRGLRSPSPAPAA